MDLLKNKYYHIPDKSKCPIFNILDTINITENSKIKRVFHIPLKNSDGTNSGKILKVKEGSKLYDELHIKSLADV